ncbi:MAG: metal-sensitive transcriptional regulator [Anaerolineaceae bacterium]|nr:metal-sensitive transcriptional regulator [Anaerolineaceae bacterium]
MKLEDAQKKQNLMNRLKRIEGQVRGVQNMIQEERGAHEIIQQLTSIRSAIQGTSASYLQEYVKGCVQNCNCMSQEKQEEIYQDMIALICKVT